MKRIISIIICFLFIFSIYIPVNAVNNDKLEIKFQIGSTKLELNGKSNNIIKPYVSNNTVFVPMVPILEAYGAEINVKGKDKVNLLYRDISIDITVGSKSYTINEMKKNSSAAPVMLNKTIMIPVNFITENFGGKLTSDKGKKNYTIILEDDGAISDFSTVIGSIGKPRIGNSYFGWNISIPKGSQVVNTSFSSKSVSVENIFNELNLDIDVSVDEGKKLEEIAKKIKEEKDDYDSEFPGKVLDVYVNTSISPQCVEIQGNVYGKGATIQRIILSNGYEYKISVSAANETNPKKIKDKPVFMNVLDSFKLGYKGSQKDVYDISKVKQNKMVTYSDSLYGFSFEVFPEWDNIKNYSYYNSFDSYSLKVGSSVKECIGISPKNISNTSDMEKYLESVKAEYESNYNPKYYTFLDKQTIELKNIKIYKLSYMLQYKDQKYVKEDNFILQGSVVFNISLKSTKEKYDMNKEKYKSMLETIKYDAKYTDDELKKIINSRENTKTFSRMGNDDNLTDYENKEEKWKIKLPGYWLSLPDYEEVSTVFYNEKTQAYVSVETIRNNSSNKNLEDEVRFDSLGSSAEDEEFTKLIEKKNLSEKGTNVKSYYYRYESAEEELYSDVYYYIIDNNDYSYCFMYMLPDVYASEKNLKEIKDIWNSFSINK